MPDVLSTAQRRLNMARIKARDTMPEMAVRRGLHARGLRFRLHRKDLPGRPDLVFPRHRVAVFVHGCFWHAHNCHLFQWPQTRSAFWREKLRKNRERDATALSSLEMRDWRVLTVWECALKGPGRLQLDYVLNRCEEFILDPSQRIEAIRGTH